MVRHQTCVCKPTEKRTAPHGLIDGAKREETAPKSDFSNIPQSTALRQQNNT